jgi:hypothetical protein
MATAAEDTETVKLQVEGFPGELRRELKATAARRGMTMQDASVQAIRNWIALPDSEEEASHGDG